VIAMMMIIIDDSDRGIDYKELYLIRTQIQ